VGRWGVISVTDQGSGIDPEDLERIFEPFFTTKNLGEGTGLGLATVWWIVKESGGLIDLVSHDGKGTTITIHLPAGEEITEEVETSVSNAFPKMPILVVEDDDLVRLPLVECLRTLGCKVESAKDGSSALAIVKESELQFGYLLSDLIMPGLNGRELAAKMRILIPGIKIVLMSGYDPGPIDESQDGLFVLAKPFTLDDLRDAFSRAV
jgi:CheY-like chemotaxis protein